MDRRLSRRSFLVKGSLFLASASAWGPSCRSRNTGGYWLQGDIRGADWKTGHMLLEDKHSAPDETLDTGIIIIGGGIAGLSAARELKRLGASDFILLELADQAGGNAASGKNQVSGFPWGAHYIPIPGDKAVFVRELFEELGVIEGYDKKGLPIYNEFYLCASPQERLYIHGHWQEGLVPQLGISDNDRRQYGEFFGAMKAFRDAKGRDGRRAFEVPLDLSSGDSRFTRLDEISMERYMTDNGWDSPYLRWYVNYCCRDDYGCGMDHASAWAGIHYFACRDGMASNAESGSLLTWPEGLGWIVKRLASGIKDNIKCGHPVLNVEDKDGAAYVDCFDTLRGRIIRIRAKAVIYAAPRFTAMKTVKAFRQRPPAYARNFSYAPWMVANITVRDVPEGKGAPLSWDNVSFKGGSLGYVNSSHQDIRTHRGKAVLTYYFPLSEDEPANERTKAINTPLKKWQELVIKDLSFMHPGIEAMIEEIDVWIWGHAMIRPLPGFVWGEARRKALAPYGNIFFANSDMSGISIFEEAQYRGIIAARAAAKKL